MVCCNVMLNILLIPKEIRTLGLVLAGMGPKGAAIATVVSYSVGLLYSRIMAWKLTQIKGNRRISLHAFAAGVMVGILHSLKMVMVIGRWYQLLFIGLLGLGIYLDVLVLFKEFTKEDMNFFLDMFNWKEMVKYIKEELRIFRARGKYEVNPLPCFSA